MSCGFPLRCRKTKAGSSEPSAVMYSDKRNHVHVKGKCLSDIGGDDLNVVKPLRASTFEFGGAEDQPGLPIHICTEFDRDARSVAGLKGATLMSHGHPAGRKSCVQKMIISEIKIFVGQYSKAYPRAQRNIGLL